MRLAPDVVQAARSGSEASSQFGVVWWRCVVCSVRSIYVVYMMVRGNVGNLGIAARVWFGCTQSG